MSNAAKHRKKAAEFEQLKQIDRAIASYVRAIEESEAEGEDVDVALLNKVGDLALRQGRVPDAVTYYERAVEHYATAGLFNNAIALCNKILRNAPGRSNVYFTLGRICAKKGLRGDATRNFLDYAARMQQEGRVEEAMRALAEVADLMPELTEVRRLVDEHATRAGVALPRRRTPLASEAVVVAESSGYKSDKSSNLVFLEIDYGAAQSRMTPPLAVDPVSAPHEPVAPPPAEPALTLPFIDIDAPSVALGRPLGAVDDFEPTEQERESVGNDTGEPAPVPELETVEGMGSTSQPIEPVPSIADASEAVDAEASHTLELLAGLESVEFSSVDETPTASLLETTTPASVTPVHLTPVRVTAVALTPVAVTPVPVAPVDVAPLVPTPVSAPPVSATPVSSLPVSATPVSTTPLGVASIDVSASESPTEETPETASPSIDEHGDALSDDSVGAPTLDLAMMEPPALEHVSLDIGVELAEAEVSETFDASAVDLASLDLATIELDVPEIVTLDLNAPDLAPPDLDIPELAPLDLEVPELASLELELPELDVPGLDAMGLDAPELPAFAPSELEPVELVFVEEVVPADPTVEPAADSESPSHDLAPSTLDVPPAASRTDVAGAVPLLVRTATPARASRLTPSLPHALSVTLDAALEAGAEAAARAAADLSAQSRRPPFRLDPHDFILPGELPPLVVDDEMVLAGLRRTSSHTPAVLDVVAPETFATPPAELSADMDAEVQQVSDPVDHSASSHLADLPVATDVEPALEPAIASELAPAVESGPATPSVVAAEVDASDADASPLAGTKVDGTEVDAALSVRLTPSLPIAAVAAEANAVAVSRRDELRAAVAAAPQDWALRRRLGEALFEAGQREAGLSELEAALNGFVQSGAIEAAADVSELLVGVSPERVSYHQKRVELAVRLQDQQRLRFAYLDLADTLVRSGEEARAQAVYVRVLEIDPLDDRARAALGSAAPPPPAPVAPAPVAEEGFVNLADWLREDDGPASTRMRMREPVVSGDEDADFAALLRHFKDGVARSLGEEDFESRYDLGVAYKEMGLLDDAIGEFQKALRSRSHRLPAYEALGQCFVEQGRYQVAATVLSRALHEPGLSDEQRVGVLYLLAYSCEALQRWGEARSYFQRVYATDINFRDVAARLAALEQLAS